MILGCLIEAMLHSGSPTLSTSDKQALGTCSLVVRYWARRCRPYLLRSIIRSSQECSELINLLHSSGKFMGIPRFADCLETIRVQHKGPWPIPWFHHLHGIFLRLRDTPKFSIELINGEDTVGPSSFCTSLPRTLPRTVFPFRVLFIRRFHFPTLSEYFELMNSLPLLEELHCSSLLIKDISNPLSTKAIRHVRRSKLSSISIHAGDPSSCVPLLFHTLSIASRGRMSLSNDAWQSVQHAAEALRTPFQDTSQKRATLTLDLRSEHNIATYVD